MKACMMGSSKDVSPGESVNEEVNEEGGGG